MAKKTPSTKKPAKRTQKKTKNLVQTKVQAPTNCNTITFIIMGGAGDLATRKLIPAVYHLLEDKTLSKIAVILTARSPRVAKDILSKSKKFIPKVEKTIWKKLENSTTYHQMDFTNPGDYKKLEKVVEEIETQEKLCKNRIFYLATIPQNFYSITTNLAKTKLNNKSTKQWSRIVYEKPFGEDYKSAKKINKGLQKVFKEEQVFRVDHYLQKELVSNISLLRFTNRIFEPLWNNKHIESIQIVISETLDVENRGRFYDSYGALKDVLQNHALQLLALTCMQAPEKLAGTLIQNQKAAFLKSLVVKDFLLSQYQNYNKTKGVQKDSNTETFATVKLQSALRRWKTVPFFIKTGKALDAKQTVIHIKFKAVECKLDVCPTSTNTLTINIDPSQEITLSLNSKQAKKSSQVVPIPLTFNHKEYFQINTPKAYETLLLDVINASHSSFVRSDEIEFQWKLIDKIKAKQKKYPKKYKVHNYKKASKGPEQLKQWSKKHKIEWVQ